MASCGKAAGNACQRSQASKLRRIGLLSIADRRRLQPATLARAMEWRRGLQHIYTADATARTSNSAGIMSGSYELWLFPIVIQGEGGRW